MGDPATIQDLELILRKVFNYALRLAGIAVFVMFLIGGFKFLTSGGDPEKTKAAKGTLTSAVLGLFLMIVSWLVLLFIQEFTGVEVTQFNLPEVP